MSVETIRTETVFEGKVFNVRLDTLRLPNGNTGRIDVVVHHGAVTLLPLDDEGQIWFIRQYRHPAGEELLELPAGVMEEMEAPEYSASREIREETGMAAADLKLLGEFFLAPGYSTEYMYVYLATGLHASPLQMDEDESIEVEKIPVSQAYRMAEEGQIRDSKSLAALLLARPLLQSFL